MSEYKCSTEFGTAHAAADKEINRVNAVFFDHCKYFHKYAGTKKEAMAWIESQWKTLDKPTKLLSNTEGRIAHNAETIAREYLWRACTARNGLPSANFVDPLLLDDHEYIEYRRAIATLYLATENKLT